MLNVRVLSSDRTALLRTTLDSLVPELNGMTYDLVVHNHQGGIAAGRNYLYFEIPLRHTYTLCCEDDWLFFSGGWLSSAIKILDRSPDIGIVRLRKDDDGQRREKTVETGADYDVVSCWRGGFTFNPILCRTELVCKLGRAPIRPGNTSEDIMCRRYSRLGLKTIKLHLPQRGSCIHIGRDGSGINFH